MTCDDARGKFSDLYDEALSGAPLVTITQHLATCPACRAEWASFRKALQAVADLGTAEPPSGFAARVRQRLEAPSRWQRVVHRLFFPLNVKVPIQAMAVLLVAFAGLLLYQRSSDLRRAVSPTRVLPSPSSREVPAPTPPPSTERRADKLESAAPRTEAPTGAQTAPPAVVVPKPAAPSETGKDRRPSTRQQAKRTGESPASSEVSKPEEPAADSRAKGGEPVSAPQTLRQAAPAPGERGGAVAPGRSSPKSLTVPPSAPRASPAPTRSDYLSSLQGMPADALYAMGLSDLADRKYERSIDDFRAFLGQYPQDPRAPDARLRLGQAYFGQSRYAEALREYGTLVQQFPSSPLVPTALFLQAQTRLAQGDRSGCQALRDVVDRYPQSPEATSAGELLSARCP